MSSLDEMLVMKKRFQLLMRTLNRGEEGQRISSLLSLADMASTLTEQEQSFVLNWLHSLRLDENLPQVEMYMTLIMWLLGDVTEYRQAWQVFQQLEATLPAQMRKQIVTSFERGEGKL